jgi:hypothetical protein
MGPDGMMVLRVDGVGTPDEVTARVSSASGGKQTPWVARRDLFGDFAISRANPPH